MQGDSERNIKLTLAYDGTHYLGWQKTPEGPSIEEALGDTLELIYQQKICIQAASRTDAGVHACGQVVSFKVHQPRIALQRLCISLNSLLPKDIVIREAEEVAANFHPTLDSSGKQYAYMINTGPYQMPHNRFYAWHVYHQLDYETMEKAAGMFIGRHDFAAFCNAKKNENYDHTIRTIEEISITNLPDNCLKITIKGNNFLYKMVRNIVGTLIYIGLGKIAYTEIPKIISNKKRQEAGITAPAHGLFLEKVFYGNLNLIKHEGPKTLRI